MSSSRPISSVRTVWLIAGLATRRQLNVWQSARFRAKKNDAPPLKLGGDTVRSGTATKGGGRSIFSIFVLLVMAFNGFTIGSRGLTSLAAKSRMLSAPSDAIQVSSYTHSQLVAAESALRQVRQMPDPVEREKYLGPWDRHVESVLRAEVRRDGLSEEDENQRVKRLEGVFNDKGAAGFSPVSSATFWVTRDTWPPDPKSASIFLRSLSLIVLLWVPFIVSSSLGMGNKNLGEVEWGFEWLYTFPVSARALFASRVFVYSLLNPLVWVFLFPFLILIYVAAGLGWLGIFVGLGVTLYLSVLAGSLCTFLEVVLRKLLSLSQLKNIQAMFTVLGTVSLLLVYAACYSQPLDDFLVARATAMPEAVAWNPVTLPLVMGLPSASVSRVRLVVAVMVAVSLGFCALALAGTEWLTRDGLVKASGPYQGTRRITARRRPGKTWFHGVAAHELLLLARDRNLLVQVFVAPLAVPVFYLLIYSGMASAVSGNFRHAAVMAFGVGAYSFLSSAMPILNREDKTLWQLLTFPQSLSTIFLKKTLVWAALGLLYGSATLVIIARFSHHLRASSWSEAFLALYGIVIYAFIAAGIGILATNVLETERRARFRADMVYLYMLLAAMYANTIYSPSPWIKITQLVLSTLLAFALWQKVSDASPFILDPVAQPPRSISLADGLIAALAFFVVQALVFIFSQTIIEDSQAVQTSLAYVTAGLVVAGLSLLIFSRQHIPGLWRAVGFVRSPHDAILHPRWQGIALAVALGAVAALGANLYLRALNLFPQGQIWRQDAELSSFLSRGDRPIWICVLAIVAAPVFEEFIFRGLIFQGLRRTTGPALAILGSAALFAIVHPPISVIPVFGLGIAAAVSFQRSRFLLAPMLTHAVYNAIVIFTK